MHDNGRGPRPGRFTSMRRRCDQPRGAFRTLPAFRQDVQTLMRRGEPSTIARTRCRFGSQLRLVCRCELLTL